jgi:hypothetical protein
MDDGGRPFFIAAARNKIYEKHLVNPKPLFVGK